MTIKSESQWMTPVYQFFVVLALFASAAQAQEPDPKEPVVREIGARRELFVDRFLIDRLENATLKLHEPRLAPAMMEPADNLEYGTVIKDGDLFRLYTRDGRGAKFDGDTAEVTRYCESRDGIHWTKPKLGLFEVDGSKDNNVILHEAPFCHDFMTTRGASPYDRTFREAFIRPGLDPDRWGNRSNYAALNFVPTGPTEMSIYTTPFRRFTLRTDGFASVHVGADVGEFVTQPLRFAGKELVINYSTSAGGSVRVEVQDESGQPIPDFTLADSRNLVGDTIEQQVSWTKGSDVSSLAGQPVCLRFVMQEADLYSLVFE